MTSNIQHCYDFYVMDKLRFSISFEKNISKWQIAFDVVTTLWNGTVTVLNFLWEEVGSKRV